MTFRAPNLAQPAAIILLAAAALMLAACGDGEDSAGESVAVAEGGDAPPSVEPGPEPPGSEAPEAPAAEVAAAPEPSPDPAPGALGDNPTPPLPPLVVEDPPLDPEMSALIDVADTVAGRTYLQRCAGCHAIDPATQGPGAAQIGPPLADVLGRPIGGVAGFDYSDVMRSIAETGAVWTEARLDVFLTNPAEAIPGTTMIVGGVPGAEDRANIIAFLRESSGRGPAPDDPELLARIAAADPDLGRTLAGRCSGCHRFEEGAAPLIGPNLVAIVGGPVAATDFAYSPAMRALAEEGAVWTYGFLDAFLARPAVTIPGTRMGFAGIADAGDRAAIIAYLRTLSPEPPPLFVEAAGIGNEQAGLEPVAFTAVQVDLGGGIYRDGGCTECHGAELRGEIDLREDGFGIAPPLVGPNFVQRWFRGTVQDLYAYLESRKPRGDPGTLPPDAYADLIAYILARNGFTPADVALVPDPAALERTGFFQ